MRKQSYFLLAAFLLAMACLCMPLATITNDGLDVLKVFNLWILDGQGHHSFAVWPLMLLMLSSAVLSLLTIFYHRRRPFQARLVLANIVLVIAWYLALATIFHRIGGTPHLALGSAFPLVAAMFMVLARKGILADERLLRSADRIR